MGGERVERRLAAILAADVAGYSRLMDADEESTLERLKALRNVAQAEVGGLAEGIAFSPDDRFLYVGNFADGNIDVLRLDGDALTKIASLALPGHPASMRGSTP